MQLTFINYVLRIDKKGSVPIHQKVMVGKSPGRSSVIIKLPASHVMMSLYVAKQGDWSFMYFMYVHVYTSCTCM